MPPIPKFAKEIVKRAKAKPKVIATKSVEKKQLIQKFAKDDMELAKARKKGIRKALEKNFLKNQKMILNY